MMPVLLLMACSFCSAASLVTAFVIPQPTLKASTVMLGKGKGWVNGRRRGLQAGLDQSARRHAAQFWPSCKPAHPRQSVCSSIPAWLGANRQTCRGCQTTHLVALRRALGDITCRSKLSCCMITESVRPVVLLEDPSADAKLAREHEKRSKPLECDQLPTQVLTCGRPPLSP